MSYIQKTLMPDEQILYYTHPHWIIFASTLLWLLVVFFLPAITPHAIADFVIFNYTFGQWLVGVILVLMLYNLLSNLISYRASEYAITSKRIIMKTGFISRHSFEVFLQRVESIQVSQSIFGRLMNYGTIVIGGVGGSKDAFYFIPDPLAFRQQVQEKLGFVQK